MASKLLCGTTPTITDAIAFTPGPPQDTLTTREIGDSDTAQRLDPTADLPVALVEARARARRTRDHALHHGDTAAAARADGTQRALKAAANSLYGCSIELNATIHDTAFDVTVAKPDGDTYQCRSTRHEHPGQYFNPIVATLTTAGGRLLLALAQRLIEDAGGIHAFCDTDSLAIVTAPNGEPIPCPGGPQVDDSGDPAVGSLTPDEVADICERFNQLNPYDPDLVPQLLKVEHGHDTPVWCWSIAAKRYALYQHDPGGGIEVVHRSEHALGHLATPPGCDTNTFHRQVWECILATELGFPAPDCRWLHEPAYGRLTATTPQTIRDFAAYNAGKPYHQQVRPQNFLTTAHPHPLAVNETAAGLLIACHGATCDHPHWIDRQQPNATVAITSVDPLYVIDGHIPVQTLHTFLSRHQIHAEAKALDAQGRPCTPGTCGLLQPRHIHATALLRCGKEANHYTDNPDQWDPATADTAAQYPEPLCAACGAAVDHRHGRQYCNDACRKRHARATRNLTT